MITPIFGSTGLCVTACGIMHRYNAGRWPGSGRTPLPGYQPATSWMHYTTSCNTQSNGPEDGCDHHPKHVELIGIINKLLFFASSWCLYHSFLYFPQILANLGDIWNNTFRSESRCALRLQCIVIAHARLMN